MTVPRPSTRARGPRPHRLALQFAVGLGCSLGLAGLASAQSLLELYESARGFDATYLAAKAQADATLRKADQAKASILPSASLAAGSARTNYDPSPGSSRSFTTNQWGVQASQPLYRAGNWASYEQGLKQAGLAEAQLEAAEQDLIVRVAQAYFDVLAAQESLTYVTANKAAIAEQLAAAKRNFEVGTTTITDTREAQARFDLAVAQELAAENDLRIKRIVLDQLVGRAGVEPKPLAQPVALPDLVPADVADWVRPAEAGHPGVRQAQINLEVAELETDKAKAGHKPTLDLTAAYTNTDASGSTTSPTATKSGATTVGVQFNLPLFAGFATQNRVRETLALEEKARNDLDGARRSVTQGTRQAFFGVLTGQTQVKALEAAEASSQSALDANKLGYQVGVRINIDVLNAQSQLYSTKRDLAKARFDVLVGGLKLRQASGQLKPQDLAAVNSLLAN